MPKPNPIAQKLKWAGARNPHSRPAGPVWKGPEEDGITFSLLSRFLVCRERFRLLVVEGLAPQDQFNHRLEYGNLWHTCEEALAAGYPWEQALTIYARNLARRYPASQEEVDKWYQICKMQFPLYVQYWKEHPDVVQRSPVLQEVSFRVPYELPSGRRVLLRGKWDSVDVIGVKKSAGIYLQENKTKGDIDEAQIKRQLTFDLQTMIYLTALAQDTGLKDLEDNYKKRFPILGVRYNVVRRPLSGGKGSIVQKKGTAGTKCSKCKGTGQSVPFGQCVKCGGAGRIGGEPPETKEAYYERLAQYIKDEPGTYFMRWKVEVGPHDLQRFRKECLDPILEQLCDWWDYVKACSMNDQNYFDTRCSGYELHWRHPFGCYNILDEGGATDLDEYLNSGSEAGLVRTTNLFPELT